MTGLVHAVVTRFNLPSPGLEARIRNSPGWLDHRIRLFERYTLPSMTRQTAVGATWLVYVDPASPPWLIDRLTAHESRGLLHLRHRTEVSRSVLLGDIADAVGGTAPTLITTNLDNDDGLASDFLARIQAVEPPASRSAIFLSSGLVVTARGAYLHHDPSNAFASVREPWDSAAHTCWWDWHTLLRRSMPTVSVPGPPAWLQVVHGRNVSNRTRGHLIDHEAHRPRFGDLLDGLPPLSRGRIVREWVDWPLRTLLDGARVRVRDARLRVLGRDGFDQLKSHVLGALR